MAIDNVLAVIPVADHDAALAWYGRLLGRPPDRSPMAGLAEWQVTETGGFQVLRFVDRAGTASLTLAVDDLEAHVAELASRGVAVGAITAGEMARFVVVTDPAGNAITFAQPLTGDR